MFESIIPLKYVITLNLHVNKQLFECRAQRRVECLNGIKTWTEILLWENGWEAIPISS